METDKVLLVVCGTLAAVLLINAGILVTFLRSNPSGQLKTLGRALEAARHPFRIENDDLDELRQRVSKFETQASEEPENGS